MNKNGRSNTVRRATSRSDHAAPTRRDNVAGAYTQLRELIVHGRVAPGSRVVESEIAERLGVSRTPVRSALRRLQQEGYILALDLTREHRLTIAPLTLEDGREIFSIVAELEALAARKAALLPPSERTALVRRLRKLNRDLADAGSESPPSPMRLFDLDTTFHRVYVEGAAGPRVLALHDSIKPQAERYARLYHAVLMEIMTSVREHDTIILCIDAGDADRAQEAVEQNWRNAAERLGTVIARVGERGQW